MWKSVLASYYSKNVDTWIYTNSSEVFLKYDHVRFGQLQAYKLVTYLATISSFRDKTQNFVYIFLIYFWDTFNIYIEFFCRNRVTWNNRKLSFKSWPSGNVGFEIMFKCMSGFTTENGKFIMPLQEKLSYGHSFDRCDSFGFTNHS